MGNQLIRCELIEEPSDEFREVVGGVLRDHNASANPEFWRQLTNSANAAEAINVFARDQRGDVVGGLLAETQFSWLKISVMSVSAPFRSQGIGSELLRIAEDEAARRGCRYAYVDTMEYQAPQFYRRRGYQAAGELKDWDSRGHSKYLFTKPLTGGDGTKQN